MTITLEQIDEPKAERRPGDFKRSGEDGNPWVSDPNGATVKSGKRAGQVKWVQYRRPSGEGKRIENQYNLLKYKERRLVLGVGLAMSDAEHAELASLHPDSDEFRSMADGIVARAYDAAQMDLAAKRGTHGHLVTEDNDLERDWVKRAEDGEALGIPRHVQDAMVQAWNAMLEATGLQVLAVELPVVCDRWRLAGTLDRIVIATRDLTLVTADGEVVTIAAGTVFILDIKTGKLRIDRNGVVEYWLSYAVQLAGYAHSLPYDTNPDVEARGAWAPLGDIPEPSKDIAVIAHLPVEEALAGKAVCRLIAVDLRAGEHAAEICKAAREWQARTDVFTVAANHEYVVDVVEPTDDPFADLPRVDDTPATAARQAAVTPRRNAPVQRIVPVTTLPEHELNGGEGPNATDAQWQAIVDRLKALRASSPMAFDTLEAVVKAALAESPSTHGISRKTPSRRRLAIYRALLALAEHFGDELADEHLRCLGLVIADAQQLSVPIHRALLALTCAEAERFHRVALAVCCGEAVISYDLNGAPVWLADVDALAASPAA